MKEMNEYLIIYNVVIYGKLILSFQCVLIYLYNTNNYIFYILTYYNTILSFQIFYMNNYQQSIDLFQVTSSVTQDFELYKNQILEVSPDKRFKKFNQILLISAFKTVYKAYDAQTGRQVCWNSINFHQIESNERKNILKQINLMKSFNHNNLIKCIDSWINKQNKEIIFITQLMNGGILKSHLKKIKRPKLKIIKTWCKQILNAIQYLHSFEHIQILHKNIKLENLYINTNSNEIKIGQIGIYISNSKCSNIMFGSNAYYDPPQLAEGRTNYNSDIYSFGMMLLQIVTMKTPYSECTSIAQTYKKIINYTKPTLLQTIQNPQLKKIISKCIDIQNQRPSLKDLLQNPFWNINSQIDNYEVSLLSEDKVCSIQTIQKSGNSRILMNEQSKQIKNPLNLGSEKKNYRINDYLDIQENENELKIIFTLENKQSVDFCMNKAKYSVQIIQELIKLLIQKFQQTPSRMLKQDQMINFYPHLKSQASILKTQNLFEYNQLISLDISKKIKQNFHLMYQDYLHKIQNQLSQHHNFNFYQILDQRFNIQLKELVLIHFNQKELKQKEKNSKFQCKANTFSVPSHSQVLNKLIDILDYQYPQLSVIDNSQMVKYQAFKNIMNNGDIAFNDSSIYHIRDELINAEFDPNNLKHEFQRFSEEFKQQYSQKVHLDIQQAQKSRTSQRSKNGQVQLQMIMKKCLQRNEYEKTI